MGTARRRLGPWLAIWLVAGCTAASGSPGPSRTPPPPSVTAASSTAAASPSTVVLSPTSDRPPDARLAAEGGDPVAGQLGSYTWADGGSDSPWLPGAPITVGVGEPLSIAFEPRVGVDSWGARVVPSTANGPEGAAVLDQGAGAPAFTIPAAGSWTVEVRVVFADGAGDASYFWKIEVS